MNAPWWCCFGWSWRSLSCLIDVATGGRWRPGHNRMLNARAEREEAVMADVPKVEVLTEEQLRVRRSQIVHSLPERDEYAFRRRAHNWELTLEQRAVYEELDTIDYLLRDDR
jgi:hypothetical protein